MNTNMEDISCLATLQSIIKKINNETEYENILNIYLNYLTTEEGFNFANAYMYVLSEEIELVKLENGEILIEDSEEINNPLLQEVIEKKSFKTSNYGRSVIMPLESQGSIIGLIIVEDEEIISPYLVKALETFAIQTSVVLDLVKLKLHMEVKVAVKTLELSRTNKKLKQMNDNLENIVNERTKQIKNVQTEMIQKEKLASIGQLAAGVAHELNNPIGFVTGNFTALKDYFEMIKEYLDLYASLRDDETNKNRKALEEKIKEIEEFEESTDMEFILDDINILFDESEEGLTRVTTIVKNLKEFSRIDNEKMDAFDINKGIKNSLSIAENEYKYCADIITELGEIHPFKANGSEINEVILNIIVNAAQAIKELESKEKRFIKIKTYQDDDTVYCEIEDNGPGIPEEIRGKIFDPFFTTKEPGKGTGLGLNIAYDIITNKHEGNIEVISEVGKGTKFILALPID